MTPERERLSRELANEGANSLLERHHMHLPLADRCKLHAIYYDALLGAIWAYEEVRNALNVRTQALASEN